MSDYPERVWVNFEGVDSGFGPIDDGYEEGDTIYIRADLVPQWQPIETSPRDGTRFLAFVGGQWHGVEQVIVKYSSDTYLGYNNTPWQPTHWMPLPSPPTT